MTENTNNPGLSISDINAEVLSYSIEMADSPIDLRDSYDRNYYLRRHKFLDVSKPHIQGVAETAIAQLYAFGLEMENRDDQRIDGVWNGLEVIKASEDFGPDRHHDTDRPETVFLAAYHRLLSAIDVRSEIRLQLLPQVELKPQVLFQEIAAAALKFTEAKEFEIQHRYPRKAVRQVSDPASPYWEFSIYTDDQPGRQFGREGRGPTVWVSMPTGIVSDESVKALDQYDYLANDTWAEMTVQGFIPASIEAQFIRMGVPARGADQVDTTTDVVKDFLRYAGEV